MTKKKSHSGSGEWDPTLGDDPDAEEQETQDVAVASPPDPDEPQEYTVLTDGAMFPKDKLLMRKADVPAKAAPESDFIMCSVGDVVSLTLEEAKAKRESGVALAERVPE